MVLRNARFRDKTVVLATTVLLCPAATALAQIPGTVMAEVRIGDGDAALTGGLDAGDGFGASTAFMGDLDGDGVADLVVGSRADDDGGTDRGAVWVLFLSTDGSIRNSQKISATQGGFTGRLDRSDRFGVAVAGLGDIDGDGVFDLAVGASGDDDGGTNRGAAWVLFLNADGTVRQTGKISDTQGRFFGRLDSNDLFGAAITSVGDLNGDDVPDMAVGAPFDDDGGTDRGAVWMLFMNADGTVSSNAKISSARGGFTGMLENRDWFGEAIANLGDVDGDGVNDMAVGARGDDDGGSDRGAVWVLFLNADGSVKAHQKISATEGGFTGGLDASDYFGNAVSAVQDLDGDDVGEMVVGAFFDDDGGDGRGAAWMLFMNTDGTVKSHQKISSEQGGFVGPVSDGAMFGSGLAATGDLNDDGTIEIAVGARGDGGVGSAWLLSLDAMAGSTCTADLTGDGFVTHEDLAPLFDAWGACSGCPEDLDENGVVDFDDVLFLLDAWGSCDPDDGAKTKKPWQGQSMRKMRRFLRQTGPPRTKSSRGRRSVWYWVKNCGEGSRSARSGNAPSAEALHGQLRWLIARHGTHRLYMEHRAEQRQQQKLARLEAYRARREAWAARRRR